MSSIVSRKHLIEVLIPVIRSAGVRYKKSASVFARAAVTGEHIITWTSSGKETENTAKEGDFLVKNNTIAQEQYIVATETFNNRYVLHQQIDERWSEYLPKGEVLALLVNIDIMHLLGKDECFLIEAPWGDSQPVRTGDYLVAPLPELNQIYRIDHKEFLATYENS